MSARQDIAGLLQQWRRLTEAEGGAIQTAAWAAVKEIEAAKAGLQKELSRAMGKWTEENAGAVLSINPFRAEVDRLISLEMRNREWLAAQQQRAQMEKESSDRALRTLRRVQRSYARQPDTAWNSYS